MQTKRRELFTTVRTEGAILPADLLQRIVDGDSGLEGLKPEDFHRPDERLNEVINGAWNRVLGQWQTFQAALAKLPESDPATSVTRERWLLPLFRELDYGRLGTVPAIEVNGKSYAISHGWQKTPIHLVGSRIEMDRRSAGVAGAARTSPHSLLQELLNQSDDRLWGFVSNGQRLRILRNNISLTRQAFVEFDLEAMMDGEVYADFALLWLLCHQSRVEGDRPDQCWLEKWSRTAQETGTRALDTLRQGVEDAIKALGRGFLAHQHNAPLRQKLRDGSQKGGLDTQDYYRQVLRLVYRLLFLFAAEDRGLLLLPSADEETRKKYANYYSTARLRHLAERHRGTRHCDLYQGLAVVMQKLGTPGGCAELGLPALGGFLWSDRAMPDLFPSPSGRGAGVEGAYRIANTDFLEAIRALAFTVDGNVLRAVDYKNLGAEELGSVYESLLELHPKINADAATFELDVAAGHERKTTGSYYTPTSLITCLLDSALDPVLEEAAKKPTSKEADAAILAMKVCDPACGSGHFLIAAAYRIAKRLAAVRTGDEEPAPEAYRQALRDVIGHCIFGVDINPMAVELCKINLWLESLEPGKPLSFLDHHFQCGNSLLGATPALLNSGIPDEAFVPIEGDDKKLCTEYKKQNRDERRGQKTFFTGGGKPWERMGDFAVSLANLETTNDDSLEAVRSKEERYAQLVGSADYLSGRFWCDTWCAAFVWKKTKEFDYAITEDVFRRIERNPHDCTPWMRAEIRRLSQQYQFFHWHLAFPQVFRVPTDDDEPENEQRGWSGGFDVVLGNPPWERIQAEALHFFATRRPELLALKRSERQEAIASLGESDPDLYAEWLSQRRHDLSTTALIKNGGAYPLSTAKNVNSYAVFLELAMAITATNGTCGMISQSGLATDEIMKDLFQYLLRSKRLRSLFDFENRERLFQAIDSRMKFCVVTVGGRGRLHENSDFVFFATSVEHILEPDRHFSLRVDDISLLNPNSGTCPIFRFRRDANLSLAIYKRVPVFVSEGASAVNPWGVSIRRMFDMAYDSHLFKNRLDISPDSDQPLGIPNLMHGAVCWLRLYEAKLMHHYDHRFASFSEYASLEDNAKNTSDADKSDPWFFVSPRYWVSNADYQKKMAGSGWDHDWLIVSRQITNTTNERTAIFAVMPKAGVGHSCYTLSFEGITPTQLLCFISNVNSFCFDWAARQKVAGTNFSVFIMKQLPVLNPSIYGSPSGWCHQTTDLGSWLAPRAIELSYTAWDLETLGVDCGYLGPPFRWDDERRFPLRCELDAAYFHLYGIERDDVAYIMDTFPIVRRKDEERHGEYRTKRVILGIYDAMAEAIRSGRPYQTLLDPPPGPPTPGLPDWARGRPRPANWPTHIHPPRHASGTAALGQSPPQPLPSRPAAPASWQMTRSQYQDYCKAQGRSDITENNRTYWREVEAAIQSGKRVPANVLAEYNHVKGSK